MRYGNRNENQTFANYVPRNKAQVRISGGLEGLASEIKQLLDRKERLASPRLYNLWGRPGVGKTHLVQAFANAIDPIEEIEDNLRSPSQEAPVRVLRGDSTLSTWAYGQHEESPVLIIDDLLRNHRGLGEVSDSDILAIGRGLYKSYEARQLVLITTNFRSTDVIRMLVRNDRQFGPGRIASRLDEMQAFSLNLTGRDYRKKIKRAYRGQPFSI